MDTPKTGASEMTTATLASPDLSRHWVKRLSRVMDVPIETARCWTYRRMPAARRAEIAAALLAECDRLETLIADTRRQWEGVANETARAVARGKADRAGAPAGRVGGKVNGRRGR